MKKRIKPLGTFAIRSTAQEISKWINRISSKEVDFALYLQMDKNIYADKANCEIRISPGGISITHGLRMAAEERRTMFCSFKQKIIFQICLN